MADAIPVLDTTSDKSLSIFYQMTKIISLPEFVKSASIPTPDELKILPKEAFADELRRVFPVHTKAACFLSYLYYLNQKQKINKSAQVRIDSKFNYMSRFWNMQKEFTSVMNKLAALAQEHRLEGPFGLIVDGKDKKYNLFPLDSAENIQKSADNFINDRKKLIFSMRQEAARNILKAADAAGVTNALNPSAYQTLCRSAGYGLSHKSAALSELMRRVAFASGANEKKAVEPIKKAAALVEKEEKTTLACDDLQKIAAILDIFDRFVGIQPLYGQSFAFPEDILFAFTEKRASELKNQLVELKNGESFWLHDLIKNADVFTVLGGIKDSLCDALGHLDMCKIAEIIPTLPLDTIETLSSALKAAGIPSAKIDKEILA